MRESAGCLALAGTGDKAGRRHHRLDADYERQPNALPSTEIPKTRLRVSDRPARGDRFALLWGRAWVASRPAPDYALIHRELARKDVTLILLWEEHRERHPEGYQYTLQPILPRRDWGPRPTS